MQETYYNNGSIDDYLALERACPEHELLKLVRGINQGLVAITDEFMVKYGIKKENWKDVVQDVSLWREYFEDIKCALEKVR